MALEMGKVFARDLTDSERKQFSTWAGLPLNSWTPKHIDVFISVYKQYLYMAGTKTISVPEAVLKASEGITEEMLPKLSRPLDREIISFFNRIFGGT